MVNISEISVNQYFAMPENEKIKFYTRIVLASPRTQKTTRFETAYKIAKQAKIPILLTKQETGKLQYVASLRRSDKQVSGLYFLCICEECNNWCILEATSFRKEIQKYCGVCGLANISTLKDISGQVFGQLQAIYPLKERANDGSVYWMCRCIDCGHEQKVVKYNLRKNSGHLCGQCGQKSKGEFKVGEILKQHFVSFEKEKIFEDCQFKDTKCYAKFDFFVNQFYVIEVDGQHHYQPVNYGGLHEKEKVEEMYQKVLKHDQYKNLYCFKHNIPIIRIPYFAIDTITYDDLKPETSKFLLF